MDDVIHPDCIIEDAKLLKRVRGGDWFVAYLVARNVARGTNQYDEIPGPSKVNQSEFSRLTDGALSQATVSRFMQVWDWCADQGLTFMIEGEERHLPHSSQLAPGDESGEWSLTEEELAALNEQRDWKQMRAAFDVMKKQEAAGVKQVQETADEMVRSVGFDEPTEDDVELSMDDEEFEVDDDEPSDEDDGELDEELREGTADRAGTVTSDGTHLVRRGKGMNAEPAADRGRLAAASTVADWRAAGSPRQAASRRFGTIERELQELLTFMNDQDDFEEDALQSFKVSVLVLRQRLEQIEKLLLSEETAGQTEQSMG